MRRVQHLIIGAGLAGLVLRRLLDSEDVVLVDPRPGGYKIGESLIPELFRHPELAALLPRLQALPSFTAKYGTTFVADGNVAYFPIGEREVGEAMHIARGEMEAAMREAWNLDVVEAHVTSIDFAQKRVSTSAGEYEVSGLVLDCSGPAMVVANLRGEVESKHPAHATWAYYDIVDEDPGAFHRAAEARSWNLLEYDVRHRRAVPVVDVPVKEVARSTYLTRIRDGVWTWQIPLFGGARLSYGVVSRHGPVSETEFRDIAESQHAPQFTLERRPVDGPSPFDRVHRRSGLARQARTPAGRDFILLADAFSFSDPVYSVGAGLAVSQAIEVSGLINAGAWSEKTCNAFVARSRDMQARAIGAFEFWYSGEVITTPAAAAEVQNDFLLGNLFQAQLTEAYGAALDLAVGADQRDPFEADWEAPDLAPSVTTLLDLDGQELEGWTLVGGRPSAGGVSLRWERDDQPALTMLVSDDPKKEQPSFRRAGDFALSYMNLFDADYPNTAALAALFDAFAARLESRRAGFRDLIEASAAG